MMEDTNNERWKSPDLALKLQRKLCGDGEYANYQASMGTIHESLAGMSKRLQAFEVLVCWLLGKQ